MSRRTILGIGIAVLVGAILLVWAFLPAPVPVEAAAARRGPFELTVNEQAKTRIRDHYAVTAPLAGELERISVREGDDVQRGDLIARLHPVLPALLDNRTELELRRRVEAARAAKQAADARVARSTIALAQARSDAERSRQLAPTHAVSAAKLEADELTLAMAGQELESARAGAHMALHDIDIAVAALARAREPGGATTAAWPVTAPISGRVLRLYQRSAGPVGVGAPLLEIGDPSNLEVLIELLTTDAPPVVAGAPVRLVNWGGAAPLIGRVRRLEPWGFTKVSALGVEEQRVNVLVDIVSPRQDWMSLGEGYRLEAQIQVYRAADALQVPVGALFRTRGQWGVYRITPANRAQRAPVKVGRRNDRDAEILDGLQPGDRVVVYPSDALRDQARVIVNPAEP